MAISMFMKIDGANGESKDANHKDWIDILSFSWGAVQPGSMAVGGGGGVGKASFNDLIILSHIDKATPAILKHCAAGKHLPKVEISVCKAGGEQVEYSKITLEDVFVTEVSYDSNAIDPNAVEKLAVKYAFQAAKVKQQYWEQNEQGGKGAETVFSFDVKQNKMLG